jgi:hypothetical protein
MFAARFKADLCILMFNESRQSVLIARVGGVMNRVQVKT